MLVDFANGQSCEYQYLMHCMNVVRADFDDVDLGAEDWFRPFMKSMLIVHEHDYRSKIGLPPLLPDEKLAQRHQTFFTYVVEGHRDPLSRWESEHRFKHADVS